MQDDPSGWLMHMSTVACCISMQREVARQSHHHAGCKGFCICERQTTEARSQWTSQLLLEQVVPSFGTRGKQAGRRLCEVASLHGHSCSQPVSRRLLYRCRHAVNSLEQAILEAQHAPALQCLLTCKDTRNACRMQQTETVEAIALHCDLSAHLQERESCVCLVCDHCAQGRPKDGPEDKFRLTPVVPRLSELLGTTVSPQLCLPAHVPCWAPQHHNEHLREAPACLFITGQGA